MKVMVAISDELANAYHYFDSNTHLALNDFQK